MKSSSLFVSLVLSMGAAADLVNERGLASGGGHGGTSPSLTNTTHCSVMTPQGSYWDNVPSSDGQIDMCYLELYKNNCSSYRCSNDEFGDIGCTTVWQQYGAIGHSSTGAGEDAVKCQQCVRAPENEYKNCAIVNHQQCDGPGRAAVNTWVESLHGIIANPKAYEKASDAYSLDVTDCVGTDDGGTHAESIGCMQYWFMNFAAQNLTNNYLCANCVASPLLNVINSPENITKLQEMTAAEFEALFAVMAAECTATVNPIVTTSTGQSSGAARLEIGLLLVGAIFVVFGLM